MSSIVVSVIITVKDGEEFLAAAFDGLLSQTFRHFEVCVFNDGSLDTTADIIQQYSSKFLSAGINFCYAYETVSNGVGFGKNAAIKLSSGRFLCFNDADDISLPNRIESQLDACLNSVDPDNCFVGSMFDRIPKESTGRYTQWACNLTNEQLHNQIYTSFGPTLIAPTWFLSRALYDKVDEFKQHASIGYPEDLDFFYRSLVFNPTLIKVDKSLVLYCYHKNCATLSVSEEIIWNLRVAQLEHDILDKVESFTIWDCGRRGRKLYRSLTENSRQKIVNYCDLNESRLALQYCDVFDNANKWRLAHIPTIRVEEAPTPVVICEKMEFISDVLWRVVADRQWKEGRDYILFM